MVASRGRRGTPTLGSLRLLRAARGATPTTTAAASASGAAADAVARQAVAAAAPLRAAPGRAVAALGEVAAGRAVATHVTTVVVPGAPLPAAAAPAAAAAAVSISLGGGGGVAAAVTAAARAVGPVWREPALATGMEVVTAVLATAAAVVNTRLRSRCASPRRARGPWSTPIVLLFVCLGVRLSV